MSGNEFCKKIQVGDTIYPRNFKTAWPQTDSQTEIHLDTDSSMRQHLN